MTRNKSIGFWCWSGSLSRAGIFNGTFTSADGGKNFAVLTDFRSPFASSYYAPAPRVGALSDDTRLTSVCLSRTSGLSREQRGLGRLQLAQSGVRVTCDSDTTFKVKRSTWRGGAYCDGLPRSLLLAVVLSLFFLFTLRSSWMSAANNGLLLTKMHSFIPKHLNGSVKS